MSDADCSILFVCTGNICRSPLAEGLFRAAASQLAESWRVDSAGMAALVGQAPAPLAIATAADRGCDITALRARQFERADFARFDNIVAMDAAHLDYLQALCPAPWTGRLGLLHDAAGRPFEVPDPYGRPAAAYRRAALLIERGIAALVTELGGNADAPVGWLRRGAAQRER
ncbi:MAG: low molecular weight protein-tyrosine-phosphatase [Gammaproteobacteria bacterium]